MARPPFEYAIAEYPLAPATYYQVGGPARWALLPRTITDAAEAFQWLAGQPVPRLVLGRGSNVLIADAGFDGYVLLTEGLDRIEPLGGGRYVIEAGVELDRVVRSLILEHNYEGAGAFTGIPGSVGGAIFMNAGTVNGATADFLESVDLVRPEGRATIATEPGLFAYRSQTFCTTRDLILGGEFRFVVSATDQRAVYRHYIERRREKQPQGPCCGSVFRNPPGQHAGRLIESCGLKGVRHGGAVISPVHANFIMNDHGASCADILFLLNLCKERVLERFGILLEEEVRIIA